MSGITSNLKDLDGKDPQEKSSKFATAIKELAAADSSLGAAPFKDPNLASENIKKWCGYVQKPLGLKDDAEVQALANSICAICHYSSHVHSSKKAKTVEVTAAEELVVLQSFMGYPKLVFQVPQQEQQHGRFIIDFLINCSLYMLCSQTASEEMEKFTICRFKIKGANDTTPPTEMLNFAWFVPGDPQSTVSGFHVTPPSNQTPFVERFVKTLSRLLQKRQQEQASDIHTQKLLSEWCNIFFKLCLRLENDVYGNVYLIQLGKFQITMSISQNAMTYTFDLDYSWDTNAWKTKLKWENILPGKGRKRKDLTQNNDSAFIPGPGSGTNASSASSSQTSSSSSATFPPSSSTTSTSTSKSKKKRKQNDKSVYEKIDLNEVMRKMSKLTADENRSLLYCGSEIATKVMDYYSQECTMTSAYMKKMREINPEDEKFQHYCGYLAAKIVFLELNESLQTAYFQTKDFFDHLNDKKQSLLRIVLFSQNDQFLQTGAQGINERDPKRLSLRDESNLFDVNENMEAWLDADLGSFTEPDKNTEMVFPSSSLLPATGQAAKESKFFIEKSNDQSLKAFLKAPFVKVATKIVAGFMKIQYGIDRLEEADEVVNSIVENYPPKDSAGTNDPQKAQKLSELFETPGCQRILFQINSFLQSRRGGLGAPQALHKRFAKGVGSTPGSNSQQASMYMDKGDGGVLDGEYTKQRSSPKIVYNELKFIASQIDQRFSAMNTQIANEVNFPRKNKVYPWFYPVGQAKEVLFNCLLRVATTGNPFWDLDKPKVQQKIGLTAKCTDCLVEEMQMTEFSKLSDIGRLKMTEMMRYAFLQSVYFPAFHYIVLGHTEISDPKLSKAFESPAAFSKATLDKLRKLLTDNGIIESTEPRDTYNDADEVAFTTADVGDDLRYFGLDDHARAYTQRCGINGYFMDKEVSALIKMALANLVI